MVAWVCYFTKSTLSGLQMFLGRFNLGWRNNVLRKTSGGCYFNKLFSYCLFQRFFEFYYPVNSASVFFELLISNLKNVYEGVQYH